MTRETVERETPPMFLQRDLGVPADARPNGRGGWVWPDGVTVTALDPMNRWVTIRWRSESDR